MTNNNDTDQVGLLTKVNNQSLSKPNVTGTKLLQFEFWTGFSNYITNNSSIYKPRKPYTQNFYQLSVGNSNILIENIVLFGKNSLRCDIWILDNKELFQKLFSRKDAIEKDFGMKFDWKELPRVKSSRMNYTKTNIDPRDRRNHQEYYKWLLDNSELYKRLLPKYL